MFTSSRIFLLWLLAMCLCLPALAQNIRGSGNIVKESRTVSGFSGIHAGGVFHIHLRQGSQYSVEVETDDNIISHVSTNVKGQTLVLKMEKSVQKVHDLNVFITMPELNHLDLSGASELEGSSTFYTNHMELKMSGAAEADLSLNADKLTADLSGAAETKLSGKSDHLDLNMSGSASLEAESMSGKTANAEMSGAAHATLHLTEAVTVGASGASNLVCHGDPVQKHVKKSGAASVVMR